MSDYTETDEFDDGTDGAQNELADLRRAANKAKKLEKELAGMKRQLAFTQAGIDTNDPKLSYFAKGYEGEFTPEAIRSAATEAGFLAAPEPAKVETPEQQAQAQGIQNVIAGADSPSGLVEPIENLYEAQREGGTDAVINQLRSMGIPIVTDGL
jgi:ribosomal protein L12E/L44/L45/RPP1/RPP2